MGTVTLRVRSVVWFVTGAVLSAAVTLMFVDAWRVDAAPGDVDSTFVGITPCRLADTRPAPNRVGPAGALGVAATQTFAVHGSNGECTIPTEAVAVSLNVTALGASELSFLTFWPDGDRPLAASLNPSPGQPPVPNAVTVDLSDTGGFKVYNASGTVDVVIDVNGYYTQISLQELASRLAAVEAAQAAGVDPAVLARLSAVETDNATQAGGIAVNTAGIAGLDAAQPFAVTNRDESEEVTTTDEVVVSVDMTVPVAGQVTVNSATTAVEGSANELVECAITTGMTLDPDYRQIWETAGSYGNYAPLAGTRTFDIDANATVTYNLVCAHVGASANSALYDSVLTAIFTPAP